MPLPCFPCLPLTGQATIQTFGFLQSFWACTSASKICSEHTDYHLAHLSEKKRAISMHNLAFKCQQSLLIITSLHFRSSFIKSEQNVFPYKRDIWETNSEMLSLSEAWAHNEVIKFTFRTGFNWCAVNKTCDRMLVKMRRTNDCSLTTHYHVHNVVWIGSLKFISYQSIYTRELK